MRGVEKQILGVLSELRQKTVEGRAVHCGVGTRSATSGVGGARAMMRQQREKAGPGQESVWDYPRPPRLEPVAERIRVDFNSKTLADTTRAYRVLETSHPPGTQLASIHLLPPTHSSYAINPETQQPKPQQPEIHLNCLHLVASIPLTSLNELTVAV